MSHTKVGRKRGQLMRCEGEERKIGLAKKRKVPEALRALCVFLSKPYHRAVSMKPNAAIAARSLHRSWQHRTESRKTGQLIIHHGKHSKPNHQRTRMAQTLSSQVHDRLKERRLDEGKQRPIRAWHQGGTRASSCLVSPKKKSGMLTNQRGERRVPFLIQGCKRRTSFWQHFVPC